MKHIKKFNESLNIKKAEQIKKNLIYYSLDDIFNGFLKININIIKLSIYIGFINLEYYFFLIDSLVKFSSLSQNSNIKQLNG